ncbi:MAG: hypothetical protein IPJ19_14050 [Planctomycetes bacterium]|nr:hypothetical protein [Planctomycetota bacterium]
MNPDTIVLSATGELPVVFSVFLQGSSTLPAPAPFGDGVRCIGGLIRRIGWGLSIGGAASYPHAGELSIREKSAALGDPLLPGSVRYYQIAYRDPAPSFCVLLGGTFNVSNALGVAW